MQQPSPTPGPLVWRDMDQKTLDDAYNQAAYAPNMDLILGRIAAASEATREILGAPYRLAYGPSEDERLDVYRARTPSLR
jgi:arylformamidase